MSSILPSRHRINLVYIWLLVHRYHCRLDIVVDLAKRLALAHLSIVRLALALEQTADAFVELAAHKAIAGLFGD